MRLDPQQRLEPVAPATINRRLVALNRFFQSTMARHLLLANPADDNSTHSLRHTFVARLSGLARLLVHASLNTMMIYTHLTLSDLARRIEQIEVWVDPEVNKGNEWHER